MATYKQKLPRVQHHVAHDSEELEQEWVMFNVPDKPIERRLVNNVSDDEEWHVLSDSSPVEEGIPFESNSEFACSDYDSEPYYIQDENAHSTDLLPEGQNNYPSLVRNMPSHDGTGNFFDTTLSDGSTSASFVDSNLSRHRHNQDNESLSSDLEGSVISENKSQDTRRTNTPIPIGRKSRNSIRESWMAKFRNVFRIEEEVASAINSQEQTAQVSQASQQIYHKFAESASSAANFELGDLGDTNPIKSLANVGNENANSITYTTVTTQYVDTLPNQHSQTKLPDPMTHLSSSVSSSSSSRHSSNVVDGSGTEKYASIVTRFGNRLSVPKDPMAINFTPTISRDMLNEMMSTENIDNADHQKQHPTSKISSQSDKNSLLSTVWTTFCRITNNIIVPDDMDPVPNDFSHPTNLTFSSSNHNTHNTGLASIITGTGENHYDTCYPPFGNHLTLSELCPSLHNYKSYYSSSSSTPPTSSYNRRRSSVTSSSNTARIFLTPASSSTSLKSFTSRAGSDCGLESGRGMISKTLEAPFVS